MKLVYYSVTSNEVPNLSEACRVLEQDRPFTLEIYARTRTQLTDQPRQQQQFVDRALAGDVVVITLMAGKKSCPAWDALRAALEERRQRGEPCPYLHIQPTGSSPESLELAQQVADSTRDGSWPVLNRYYRYGGVANLMQMLRYLAHLTVHPEVVWQAPENLPNEALYHPDHGAIADKTGKEAYLDNLDANRPTVGIWFYQNFWATNNKAHIDALIREAEAQGANVICVFHMRFKDSIIGNHGADYIVKEFFMTPTGQARIDVLLNPVMFSLKTASPDYEQLLQQLDVPVIQVLSTGRSIEEWQASEQGLNTVDITINVAQPELDGVIIGTICASKQTVAVDALTGAAVNKYVPLPERISCLMRRALNWARLGRLSNADKKIAIVFHHYPPRNDRIGCAAGLDSFASVAALIKVLKAHGYRVDQDDMCAADIAERIISGMTCDQRWLLPEEMAKRAEASAGPDQYQAWHQKLPPAVQQKMVADWGELPGGLFVHDNQLLFPGFANGHLLITVQPPRGYLEQVDQLYHDQHLSPPHHYLAHYRYISEVFGADAVIHIGKHGSLEWLPGKAVGLGPECYPDLAIGDLPNLYPYIINDPGEGTQAKRRSAACIIDHLPPAQVRAGLYGEMQELDDLLNQHRDARLQDPAKLPLLVKMAVAKAESADLLGELQLTSQQALADGPLFMEQLHHYLEEISTTAVADGLHILGYAPEGKKLVSTIVQLTRLANGPVPSLYAGVAAALGVEADVNAPPGTASTCYDRCEALVADLLARDMTEQSIAAVQTKHLGQPHKDVSHTLSYIADDLLPRIQRTRNELDHLLAGLEGRFVPEGPSGAPTRGQAHILPSGCNFYSVDPQKIPTPAAWEVGKKLADALIKKYRQSHDSYPDNVGMVLWASPTMRSKGDDIAQILYLLGVEPVWQQGSGNVTGVRVIPAETLGRPRIDVTPRISGIFRDAFPLLTELIDSAVQMVATLNEPPESNFIRRHVIKDLAELEQAGLHPEEAMRQATLRIFGAPPGSYGTGVAQLIESGAWENTDDLGNMYIRWSSYGYGKETFGVAAETQLKRHLGRMSVTVKNEDTREKDMMTCTDFYSHHGGLITAVHAVQGKRPFSVAGDSNDPDQVKVRTTTEEARHIFRSRLLNPVWLEGLKRHGYKGAGDISKAMDIILGWDATAAVVDDYNYRRFAEGVALNKEMQDWMAEVNPYALHNILNKLLEASARGMWNADEKILNDLKESFLAIEGDIEEIVDD